MTAAGAVIGARRRHVAWLRIPGPRWVVIATVLILLVYLVSLLARLAVPVPTGPHAVGRERVIWIDPSRPEAHTSDPTDSRSVPIQVWYPAQPETGQPADYVEGLDVIGEGMRSSGEFGWLELVGLRLVRDQALDGAAVAGSDDGFPVLVLSPGNATNVAFYANLAEDLASRGYVVVGVDHPYQVAAVMVGDRSVAVYDPALDAKPGSAGLKIEERVADIRFVLAQIRGGADGIEFLSPSMNLNSIGILGHSNGGLAAVEMCRQDPGISACLNIDGQNLGGPFGHEVDALAPDQPFMYLTKETSIHDEMNRRFETAGEGAVRALIPSAAHGDFTDGGLFEPRLDPFAGNARSVAVSTRSLVGAFFDHWMMQPRPRPFSGLHIPSDVYIYVYPLGDSPPAPGQVG
jgi:dienelactone hydrolase